MRRVRHALRLLLFLATAAATVHGSSISGTVRAAPPPAQKDAAAGGAYESRRYKYVEKIDYERLGDFVVYIDQPMTTSAGKAAATVVQKDATFEPHVLPVAIGTTVRWPNEDDIFHNVFSMSEPAPFDLEYYKKERVPEVTFEKVGRVDVHCAIHTKMHCIVLVLPNRFFAKTDARGRFVIPDVPPGTYKLRAWHERFPSRQIEVTVPATGEATTHFVLSVADLPKH